MEVRFRLTRRRIGMFVVLVALVVVGVAYAGSNAKAAKCPGGTVAITAGFCTETAARPALNWTDAIAVCAALGRHMPDVEQVIAVSRDPSVNAIFDPALFEQQNNNVFWASDQVGTNKASSPQLSQGDVLHIGSHDVIGGAPYFCVVG
jgi:hypothetical protein